MNHEPLTSIHALRLDESQRKEGIETLANEVAIGFVYNGLPHSVMMATPSDLDDFAYGYTLAEGIVEHVGEIEIVDRFVVPSGVSLQMLIPRARLLAARIPPRSVVGRTGCGLCGVAEIEDAVRPIRQVHRIDPLSTQDIRAAMNRLVHSQPLNDESGALHAAMILADEDVHLVREDVGRHSAIDKVICAAAQRNLRPRALLVTSRASYEVVHKAAQFNCAIVAAISAPTALAVQMAERAGMTLIGFVRDGRMRIYTGHLRD